MLRSNKLRVMLNGITVERNTCVERYHCRAQHLPQCRVSLSLSRALSRGGARALSLSLSRSFSCARAL